MSGREVVEQWLFEYSCRHRLSRAMAEIAFNHSNVWSAQNCSIPSIYVLLAFMSEVVDEQLVSQYDVVIRELTRLYDVSGDIVPFKVYARLLVALKVLVLFDMLKKDDKLVLPRLNGYFPRTGFHHEKADNDFQEKLSEGQKHFRAVFLRLIADKKQRREYLKNQFDLEYGVEFVNRMKQLLQRVINAIDGSLPPCAIDRLLGKNADKQLVDELSTARSPAFEMLLDAVNDKDSLVEAQVIDLLRNLCPNSSTAPQSFMHALLRDLTGEDSEHHQPVEVSKTPIPWAPRKGTPQTVKRGLHSMLPAAKRQRVSDVDIFCSNPIPCSRNFERERFVESSSSVDRAASTQESELSQVDTVSSRLSQVDTLSSGLSQVDNVSSGLSQVDTVSSSVEDTDLEINFAQESSDALSSSDLPKQSFTSQELDVEKSSTLENNSQMSTEESFVSDSDLQSRLETPRTHLVPSSYSFDQYDMSLGDRSHYIRVPPIEKYLRVDAVQKSCVVALFHSKNLDRCVKGAISSIKIFS